MSKHLSAHHGKAHKGRATKTDFHGSPREDGEIHGGRVAGAGELGCGDPGKAAMRVKPRMSGLPFEGAKNYSPKGMRASEDEE